MGQNNIWMRYLIIGIITNLMLISSTCKRDYEETAEFVFVNTTNYSINFQDKLSGISILPQQNYLRKEVMLGDRKVRVEKYRSPFYYAGPINIKFDNMKCLLQITFESKHSFMDIKNFVMEKVNERHHKFTYTFTEADYNRAVACP